MKATRSTSALITHSPGWDASARFRDGRPRQALDVPQAAATVAHVKHATQLALCAYGLEVHVRAILVAVHRAGAARL